jgi:TetR/AcrR family transcriptional regulator
MAEMKVLSHEADALTGDYKEQIADRKRDHVDVVRQCVEEILETPYEADGRVATFALFGMMNWIYTWYRPARDVSVDRLESVILHTFLNGISSPLPHQGKAVEGAGPHGILLFDKD